MDFRLAIETAPKLVKIEDFEEWRTKFESFIKCEDERMWDCIIYGYIKPTYEGIDDIKRVPTYSEIQDSDKQMYDAEGKVT